MSAPPQEKPVNIISLSHPIIRFGWMPQGTTGNIPPVVVIPHNPYFFADLGAMMSH